MKKYYIVSGQAYTVWASSEEEALERLNEAHYTPDAKQGVDEWEVLTTVFDTEEVDFPPCAWCFRDVMETEASFNGGDICIDCADEEE